MFTSDSYRHYVCRDIPLFPITTLPSTKELWSWNVYNSNIFMNFCGEPCTFWTTNNANLLKIWLVIVENSTIWYIYRINDANDSVLQYYWIHFTSSNNSITFLVATNKISILQGLHQVAEFKRWFIFKRLFIRVAMKIFEDFGGTLCKVFIRGRKPVLIIYVTRPGWNLNQSSTTLGLDPVSSGPPQTN